MQITAGVSVFLIIVYYYRLQNIYTWFCIILFGFSFFFFLHFYLRFIPIRQRKTTKTKLVLPLKISYFINSDKLFFRFECFNLYRFKPELIIITWDLIKYQGVYQVIEIQRWTRHRFKKLNQVKAKKICKEMIILKRKKM